MVEFLFWQRSTREMRLSVRRKMPGGRPSVRSFQRAARPTPRAVLRALSWDRVTREWCRAFLSAHTIDLSITSDTRLEAHRILKSEADLSSDVIALWDKTNGPRH
jgi:hypothetical protein